MNEVHYTQFQVRPDTNASRVDGRCVFKETAFDLDDVCMISAVDTYHGINCFFFTVYFYDNQVTPLRFEAATKSEALRWQRELYRAWTSTGEFERVYKQKTADKHQPV